MKILGLNWFLWLCIGEVTMYRIVKYASIENCIRLR